MPINPEPQYGEVKHLEDTKKAAPLTRQGAGAAPQAAPNFPPPPAPSPNLSQGQDIYADPLIQAIASQPAHIQLAEWQARKLTEIAGRIESDPLLIEMAKAAQEYLAYLMEGGEPIEAGQRYQRSEGNNKQDNQPDTKNVSNDTQK